MPITFVLLDGLVCSAVDEVKPKRSTRLARLDDVRRDPRVGLVVDHYDGDWARLWWVRVDGTAAVHDGARCASGRWTRWRPSTRPTPPPARPARCW